MTDTTMAVLYVLMPSCILAFVEFCLWYLKGKQRESRNESKAATAHETPPEKEGTVAARSLVVLLPMLFALLCASPSYAFFEKTATVQWSEVQPAVQATIAAYLGIGTVDEIKRTTKGDGQAVYDAIISMPSGQRIQLQIRAGGALVEFKYRNKFFKDSVSLSSVPLAVKAVFSSFAGGAAIEKSPGRTGTASRFTKQKSRLPTTMLSR
jgi:hypothetical protein